MVFCFPCKRLFKGFTDDEDNHSSTSKTKLNKAAVAEKSSTPRSPVKTAAVVDKRAPRPRVAIIIYSMYGHITGSESSVHLGLDNY